MMCSRFGRRKVLKDSILFAIGLAMGKLDTLKAEGGQLTCDLSQWDHVTFKYKGETVKVSTKEVFEALKETNGRSSS